MWNSKKDVIVMVMIFLSPVAIALLLPVFVPITVTITKGISLEKESISILIQIFSVIFIIAYSAIVRRMRLCIVTGIIVMLVTNFCAFVIFGEGHVAFVGAVIFPLYGTILAWVTIKITNLILKNKTPKTYKPAWLYAIACLYICILFVISVLLGHIVLYQAPSYSKDLEKVEIMLKNYIRSNDGSFPEDQQCLVENGYLLIKQIKSDGLDIYYFSQKITCDINNEPDAVEQNYDWVTNFKKIQISYGANIKDFKIVNNKLIDIKTNEPALLITGPFKLLLKKEYQKVSHGLYQEMLLSSQSKSD